jgi:hypothetical protein
MTNILKEIENDKVKCFRTEGVQETRMREMD